jgi:hypothetical protein
MDIPQATASSVSWKFLVPFRVLSILFAVIAALTFFSSLFLPWGTRILVYISYIVMYVILIYGFWKMRKWVVTLMGITFIFLVIDNSVRLFMGTQRIVPALVSLLIVGIIFLFSYFSRSQLNGEYKNMRVLRVFVVFLILSKLLVIF